MARIVPLIASALSALLLWAAFPPMGEMCAIAFAIAPLLVLSRLCAPKKAAWLWFAGGFFFWFGTLSWMPAVSKNNGPLPLVILGWAGLSALCAAYFALFGWLSARAWKKFGKLGILFEPVLWAGFEWLRSWLFTGFAWNFLGTAVAQVPSLAAPARLGGVYLVSALVVLLNGVFATLACRIMAQMNVSSDEAVTRWSLGAGTRRTRLAETALPLGFILLCFWLPGLMPVSAPDIPVGVALVQRNAPCIFSRRDRTQEPYEVFDRLLDTASFAKPDLIVWGESAMAEFGALASVAAHDTALAFSQKTGGAALLAGGDWRSENGYLQNAAGLYTAVASNVTLQVYAKQHLVPFGEYIPFDKLIPVLQKLSPIGVSLWPGEAKVLDLKLKSGDVVKIAPIICYEDTDPVLARRAANLGAQAIVLITNDSWFSHSQETLQHAWQAVMRAVETGLPVIRVGNSGVTGVIYPSGRTRWLEDGNGRPLTDAAGSMVERVPVSSAPVRTIYARLGDVPLMILFAAALICCFVRRRGNG